jgi:hypothetical protein
MNASPLEAIENIVNDKHRKSAIVFFFFFARFEYALKRVGFILRSKDAKADWLADGRFHSDLIEKSKEEDFREAVAYLENSPPKKQIVSHGHLQWTPDRYGGRWDLVRILTLVCRIRNNLFHGGKFPKGPEDDLSRHTKLLDAGVIIMRTCLDLDDHLRHFFLEELA